MVKNLQVIVVMCPVVSHKFRHNVQLNTQDCRQIATLLVPDIYILILMSIHQESSIKHQIIEFSQNNYQPLKIPDISQIKHLKQSNKII